MPTQSATAAQGFSLATCVELLKPITWFAPMWAYGCGVISSGQGFSGHAVPIIAGILLCGPMVCGTSQAVNDWFDRHVDAINEPNRPIPSGRIPGQWGLYIAIIWTIASLFVATLLGPWGFGATGVGLALAWAYSAPPLRLKANGWWGNAACGACYEGLPWVTGAAVLAGGAPSTQVLAIAAMYSLGAHGIMTLNDFKSIDGDRVSGIDSIPVLLGAESACGVACILMGLSQVMVIAMMFAWGMPIAGGIVTVLLAAQIALMVRLARDPRKLAPWYNATGTTLYVLGMLACAFALRPVA
jgi:chlorophyll synthase